MEIIAASAALGAVYKAGKSIRANEDWEKFSSASATTHCGTRRGLFMSIEIVSSWIESDSTISEASREYILGNSMRMRLNECARMIGSLGYEKVSSASVRNDLTDVLNDLEEKYNQKRAHDRKEGLVRKKTDAIDSVSNLFPTTELSATVSRVDEIDIEALDTAVELPDMSTVSPENCSPRMLYLKLSDLLESAMKDQSRNTDDVNFIINQKVVEWKECLSRRTDQYDNRGRLTTLVSSPGVGLHWDIYTLTQLVQKYLRILDREREISADLAAAHGEVQRTADGLRTREPSCGAFCIIS